jgi:hypothetical protein
MRRTDRRRFSKITRVQVMIISALLSFLGGNVFRTLFGEVFAWITSRQDHIFELDRIRLQETIDAAQHARNQDSIKLQADLGVKTIQVQAESVIGQIESGAWTSVVEGTTKTIGIVWIDAWNAAIRPGVATWAIAMLSLEAFALLTLSENSISVCSAALGIYLADRSLMKRGK